MGKKDITTKKYMRNPRIFADFFNGFLYAGEQVIDWTTLEEIDSSMLSNIPISGSKSRMSIQKFRDIIKKTVIMKNDDLYYAILGIENQSDIHYAMPVRNMLYDALAYLRQVEEMADINKSEQNISADEFLSGFSKADRMLPIITVTLYWGTKPWDAPVSLKDMLTNVDPRVIGFVNDYNINLFSIIDRERFPQYQTQLRELFLYLNTRNDDEKMHNLLLTDDAFKHINSETAELMRDFSSIKLPRKNKEGEYNMCKAIQEIERKSELRGTDNTRVESIRNLMKNLKLTAEQAMEALGIPESEYKKYMTML